MTNNPFSLSYYERIVARAQDAGYSFRTLREFLAAGSPTERCFVLRYDLDTKPATLWPMLDSEKTLARIIESGIGNAKACMGQSQIKLRRCYTVRPAA